MTTRPLAAIVLAAGKGTRMKSDLHKVLHPLAGRPMLLHLLDSVAALSPAKTVVVVGAGREQVEAAVAPLGFVVAHQAAQLGTGHAVRQAEAALEGFAGDVLILYGDVPLVSAATMRRMIDRLHGEDAPAVVVLGFRPADAGAYGRVIADAEGRIERMIEFKDASPAERAETLCNSGLMAVRGEDLFALLARVGNDNAAGEYYLPDIVMLAARDGRASAVIETDEAQVAGINDRADLAMVEALWQSARRTAAMRDGATLIAPETTWFAWDTEVGQDVVVEPNVLFEGNVHVGARARLEANLVIPSGSWIPPGAVVTRENVIAFRAASSVRSSAWTGRYSRSERGLAVLRAGPAAIASLSDVITSIERRSHNDPPELVSDDSYAEILPQLVEFRLRLSELIDAIQQRGEEHSYAALQTRYENYIVPWLNSTLRRCGENATDLVTAGAPVLMLYLGLARIFDRTELSIFMSAALGGLVGGGMAKRKRSSKSSPEREDADEE